MPIIGPGGGGGGGGSVPFTSGVDPPLGEVTPSQAGALYLEMPSAAQAGLWLATNSTEDGWVLVAGQSYAPQGFGGVGSAPGVAQALGSGGSEVQVSGDVQIQAGTAAGGSGDDGNNANLAGGNGDGAGDGGGVVIYPGTGASDGTVTLYDAQGGVQIQVQTGALLAPTLPTSDPHQAGQLYTTAGAVFVSAG